MRGRSPRSVRYDLAVLRKAFEDAVRADLVPRNVAKLVTPPRVPTIKRTPSPKGAQSSVRRWTGTGWTRGDDDRGVGMRKEKCSVCGGRTWISVGAS